jgi:hypothetical protein
MCGLKALVFLLCVSLVSVSSFTRHVRSIPILLNEEGLNRSFAIDPIVQRIEKSAHEFCQLKGCNKSDLMHLMHQWMSIQIDEVFDSRHIELRRLYSYDGDPPTDEWSIVFGTHALVQHQLTLLEAKGLFSGIFKVRENCSVGSPLLSTKRQCKFGRLVQSFHIYPPIPLVRLTYDQWSYLLLFAEELFNDQLYEHAESWTFYLLHSLKVSESLDSTVTATRKHLLISRCSLIISEIAKQNGLLELSTWMGVQTVLCQYHIAESSTGNSGVHRDTTDVHSVDDEQNVVLSASYIEKLARMRIILTIPPTPAPHSISQSSRAEMVEDLKLLAADCINQEKVPLKVTQHLPDNVFFSFYVCSNCYSS